MSRLKVISTPGAQSHQNQLAMPSKSSPSSANGRCLLPDQTYEDGGYHSSSCRVTASSTSVSNSARSESDKSASAETTTTSILKLIENMAADRDGVDGHRRTRHLSTPATFPTTSKQQNTPKIVEKSVCTSCKCDLSVVDGDSTADAYKRRLRRLRDVYRAIDDAQVFLNTNGISDNRFFCQYKRVSRARKKLEASLEVMSSKSLPLGGLGSNKVDGICAECEFARVGDMGMVCQVTDATHARREDGVRCKFVTFGKAAEDDPTIRSKLNRHISVHHAFFNIFVSIIALHTVYNPKFVSARTSEH